MPAERLEGIAPAMKKKGRISNGSDADITIFDPEKIIDRATYDDPSRFSEGIKFVIVNGSVVMENGVIKENRFSGKPIRGMIK